MTQIDKRLAEIERMLGEVERVDAGHLPDPHAMTDAEAVAEWHRLCHLRPPGRPRPEPLDSAEEAALVVEIRRLLR